jgi:phage repressor protein C with HTH and peptisase S24 domain
MPTSRSVDRPRLIAAIEKGMQRQGMTQYDIADRLGVTQPAVNGWLNKKGKKTPGPANLQKLVDVLGLRREDFETREPAPPTIQSTAQQSAHSPAGSERSIVLIPRNGYAAAGEGAFNDGEDEVQYDPYPRDELMRLTNTNPDYLRSLTVIGDSLAPEIPPNTRVIYLPLEQFRGDGLYVLSIDGVEIVKRIQYLPGGAIELIPINTDYQVELLMPIEGADTYNTFRSARTGLTTIVRCVGKVVFYPKPA